MSPYAAMMEVFAAWVVIVPTVDDVGDDGNSERIAGANNWCIWCNRNDFRMGCAKVNFACTPFDKFYANQDQLLVRF